MIEIETNLHRLSIDRTVTRHMLVAVTIDLEKTGGTERMTARHGNNAVGLYVCQTDWARDR